MAVVQTLIGNVKGPAGATGATGAQGPQGDAATIAVGSVTSAAYGTPASVTNSGTSGAAVFDFVIPQGKPGEKTTKMGELTLDTITTSTDEFPSPAVDDTGAIAFGKIRKFFADTLSALAAKIDTNKIADNLTTNDASYVLSAKQGKALNDSLTSLVTVDALNWSSVTINKTINTNYSYIRRIGKICFIQIYFTAAFAAGDTLISNIPAKYRPISNYWMVAALLNAGSSTARFEFVAADGVIKTQGALAAGTFCSGAYLCS